MVLGCDLSVDARRRQEYYSSHCFNQCHRFGHVRHGGVQNRNGMCQTDGKLYHVSFSHTKCVVGHTLLLLRYMGSDGIYTHTVQYERDPHCPVCSPGVPITISADLLLSQVNHARAFFVLHPPTISVFSFWKYSRSSPLLDRSLRRPVLAWARHPCSCEVLSNPSPTRIFPNGCLSWYRIPIPCSM